MRQYKAPYQKPVVPKKPVQDTKFLKAQYILRSFTPAEIQSHAEIRVPVKVGRKITSPILMRNVLSKGTGIPASTIKRFQNGTYKKMGAVTIKKLALMYDEYQTIHLRSIGANKEDARTFKKYSPEKLTAIINRYRSNARQIQYNYKQQGIKKLLYHIQYGMAHSKHTFSEWDAIAKISGLSKYKPPRIRRKKGYGSHRM